MKNATRLIWVLVLTGSLAMAGTANAARHLYVSAFSAGNITGFNIGPSGALTPLGLPFSTGTSSGTEAIVLTPDGDHLYAANYGNGNISLFNTNAAGSLTELGSSPLATDPGPIGASMAPDGKHLYVASLMGDSVSAFSVAADGTLGIVTGSPVSLTAPRGVATSPDGKYLYVGQQDGPGTGAIAVFAIAVDGSLTPIADSPFEAGVDPFGITITPDGNHLYTADNGDGEIFGFSIGAGGGLTTVAGTPTDAPSGAHTPVATPDGKHLYVAGDSRGSANLGAYAIAANGSLSEVAGGPFGTGGTFRFPTTPAVSPDGKHLYVTNKNEAPGTSNVEAFDIASSGLITKVGTSPFTTGAFPDFQALAFNPNQGPTARFSVGGDSDQATRVLNGSASADPDGSVAAYLWNFGDGESAITASPTTSHTYAATGTYKATLSVTDNEGCSKKLIYTGQSASCVGGPRAATTRQVGVALDESVTGGSLEAKRTQKHKGKKVVVVAFAGADEQVTVEGFGKLKANGKSFPLKHVTKTAAAGTVSKLKLKPKSSAKRKILKALKRKPAKAAISVEITDAAANTVTETTKVKLK